MQPLLSALLPSKDRLAALTFCTAAFQVSAHAKARTSPSHEQSAATIVGMANAHQAAVKFLEIMAAEEAASDAEPTSPRRILGRWLAMDKPQHHPAGQETRLAKFWNWLSTRLSMGGGNGA